MTLTCSIPWPRRPARISLRLGAEASCWLAPDDIGPKPEVVLVDLDELGTADRDAIGYGCRASFFETSTMGREKARASTTKQVARAV